MIGLIATAVAFVVGPFIGIALIERSDRRRIRRRRERLRASYRRRARTLV